MQATPQRTAAITISRVGSFATADGGVRGSVDQVAGSFEDVTAAENVSRPPSFASTHRYWPSGPDLPDPDAEASSYSLPQLAEAAGWGSLTRPSTGVDVDITQPLLENEVVLGAMRAACCCCSRLPSDGRTCVGQPSGATWLPAIGPGRMLHLRVCI